MFASFKYYRTIAISSVLGNGITAEIFCRNPAPNQVILGRIILSFKIGAYQWSVSLVGMYQKGAASLQNHNVSSIDRARLPREILAIFQRFKVIKFRQKHGKKFSRTKPNLQK